MRLVAAAALALSTATPLAAQTACGLFEAVEPGDTLTGIAERCGVPLETLVAANPGVDAAAPEVASTVALTLPDAAGTPGDTAPATRPAPGPRMLKAPEPKPERPAEPPLAAVAPPVPTPAPVAAAPTEAEIAQRYREDFAGRWAADARHCAGSEAWVLGAQEITTAGESCAVSGLAAAEGGLVATLACPADSALAVRSGPVLLALDAEGKLQIAGAGSFARCPES